MREFSGKIQPKLTAAQFAGCTLLGETDSDHSSFWRRCGLLLVSLQITNRPNFGIAGGGTYTIKFSRRFAQKLAGLLQFANAPSGARIRSRYYPAVVPA